MLFNGRVLLLGRRVIETGPDGVLEAQGRLFRDRLRRLPRLGGIRRSRASPSTIASRWPRCAPTTGRSCSARWRSIRYNAGQIYFPAGTPDPSDVFDDKVDLEASARRELLEETGVRADEASVAPGWTLVFTPQRIACMKLMTLAVPAAALKARIDAYLARDPHAELSRMHIVREPARHRRSAGADLRRRLPARRVRSKVGRITVTLCEAATIDLASASRPAAQTLRGGVAPEPRNVANALSPRAVTRLKSRSPLRQRSAGHADLTAPLSLRDDGQPRSRRSRTARR